MMKNRTTSATILLCLLFVFLPLSSWLVSYFDNTNLTLIRDGLIFLLICGALPNILIKIKEEKINWPVLITAIIFLLYGLASFFWREASVEQWLRGFRFIFLPIVMFVTIMLLDFNSTQRSTIIKSILITGSIIMLVGLLEIFHIRLPLGIGGSDLGSLQESSYIESTNILRLQSVLAGPNAFGLYLLALTAYIIGAFKTINKNFIYFLIPAVVLLILTFSRSVLLGFFALIATCFCLLIFSKFNRQKAWLITFATAVIIVVIGLLAYLNYSNNAIISHNTSTNLRSIQYQRIWDTKNEIGLFGRGLGTAGPASQYRLDGGENHWTENIYLDTFEELGLIGLLLYITLLITIIISLIKGGLQKNLTAFLAIISFIAAGFFINNYTGQAGIFLVWLAAGMANKLPKISNS